MYLNPSQLFISGGSVGSIEFEESLSPDKFFGIYKIVGSDGSVRSERHSSGSYVIYEIDTTAIDGEIYLCIHLMSFDIIKDYVFHSGKQVLFVGSGLNNQIEIDSIDDVPHLNSKVNIFFGVKNPLNGCYRVTSIDTVEFENKMYPRIYTEEKISDTISKSDDIKYIDLSTKQHSVIQGW